MGFGFLVVSICFSHLERSLEALGGEDGHVRVGGVAAAHRRIARFERVIYMASAVALGGALAVLFERARGLSVDGIVIIYDDDL